jgi:hypothetical protein
LRYGAELFTSSRYRSNHSVKVIALIFSASRFHLSESKSNRPLSKIPHRPSQSRAFDKIMTAGKALQGFKFLTYDFPLRSLSCFTLLEKRELSSTISIFPAISLPLAFVPLRSSTMDNEDGNFLHISGSRVTNRATEYQLITHNLITQQPFL